MKTTRVELGDAAIEIAPQDNGLVSMCLIGVNGLRLGVAVTVEQARELSAQLLVESIVAQSMTSLATAKRVGGG